MPFVVMLRLVTNWSSFTGKSRKPIILIQFATLKVWLWKIFIINTKQGKNYVNWCYLTFNIRLARPLSRTSRRFKQRWQSNSRFVNILIQLIDQHIIQTDIHITLNKIYLKDVICSLHETRKWWANTKVMKTIIIAASATVFWLLI